jgi:hypothetical protein
MAVSETSKLRVSAETYRRLAEEGDDLHLRVALLQLAEEFEREAAEIESLVAGGAVPG